MNQPEIALVLGGDIFQPVVQLDGQHAEHRLNFPEVVLAPRKWLAGKRYVRHGFTFREAQNADPKMLPELYRITNENALNVNATGSAAYPVRIVKLNSGCQA